MTTLADDIKALCTKHALTVAVAESLTGGMIQSTITSVSGSSRYFRGGVTAYSLEGKVKVLGVTEAHARDVNCVSEQVSFEMAVGVRRLFNASAAIATTGYAEPSPEHGIHAPFAYITVLTPGRSCTFKVQGRAQMSRSMMQRFVMRRALRALIWNVGG